MSAAITSQRFIKLLIQFARPHRAQLMVGTLFLLLEATVALALPYLGGRAVGILTASDAARGSTLTDTLVSIGAALTAQTVLVVAGGYMVTRRVVLISSDLRARVYGHLQSLPLSYFQERRQGEILSLLHNDAWVVSEYLSQAVPAILPAVITAIGAAVAMLLIDARLAAAATIAVPLLIVLLKILARSLRPLAARLQEARARSFAIEEENLAVLPLIKTSAREALENARHRRSLDTVVELTLKQEWREAAISPAMAWAAGMGILAVLYVAGSARLGRVLPAGELTAFLFYAVALTRPLGVLAALYGRTRIAQAAAARLEQLLEIAPERYGAEAPALEMRTGVIEFEDVSFAYRGRPPVLKHFSLRIKPRETVAIIGENGLGKSTLAGLLLRLHEPSSGRVMVDGQDIARVSLRSLRRAVGYVSQHVQLINGTVRDNIAYANPDADDARIRQAATLAQATTFVEALPQGFETVIGDQGIRLSGGQRQRVALARALLLNPAILILDEATAMFDDAAELAFLRDCSDVLAERTVILITHRPASLELADRVIELFATADGANVPCYRDTRSARPARE